MKEAVKRAALPPVRLAARDQRGRDWYIVGVGRADQTRCTPRCAAVGEPADRAGADAGRPVDLRWHTGGESVRAVHPVEPAIQHRQPAGGEFGEQVVSIHAAHATEAAGLVLSALSGRGDLSS